MKQLIFFAIATLIAAAPLQSKAQINTYYPDTWKEKAETQHVADNAAALAPYFVTAHKIVRDFNVTNRDKAEAFTHYRTIYKKIHVNTAAGADSLTQLVLPVDNGEELRGFRVRTIFPDGRMAGLSEQTRSLRLNDGRMAIVVNNISVQAGCELEYEMSLKVQYDYAGAEYLQSGLASGEVDFMLVAPRDLRFGFNSANGTPAITDSLAGNNQYHHLSLQQLPPMIPSELYFYLPQLKRIDFALKAAISGKDTTRMTWQQFGEDAYIPFVAVSKGEYKQLEKELDRWPFLKQRRPVPQLIYLVEQYIKTNYRVKPASDFFEAPDLGSIIRSKQTDKAGMIKLMTAAYYMLNIPVQMLYTSARDTIPLNKDLVNRAVANNILLYFPTQQQALAPTEMDTRYPCYPALWANCPALRCRDTLVGTESKVLTDFITTPTPAYTLSSSTLEATLSNFSAPSWKVSQSFGGYAAINIKSAFTKATTSELRNSVFNAILPFPPGVRKPTDVAAQNETFSAAPLDKPVVVTSTLQTPAIIIQDGSSFIVNIGQLLAGGQDYNMAIPGGTMPIEIAFPFYQEKRIHIDLPAGYSLANKEDYTADITYNAGAQPIMGFKMRCEEENNRLHIYTIEWYSKSNFNGDSKKTFEAMVQRLKRLQQQHLVLKKQ